MDVFQMPTVMKITGRTSSITNAFVSAIVPVIPPSEDDVRDALEQLGLDPQDLRCAYCGDRSTEWDHLLPLVRDKMATGYISEIANLVPSCGKCNQSKGSSEWRKWISGAAPRSPARRGIPDLKERIARLEAFERWRPRTRIDFTAAVPIELWESHWKNHERLLTHMKEFQLHAERVRRSISLPAKVLSSTSG